MLLAFASCGQAWAQHPATMDRPTFLTFVDTANIAVIEPDVYLTWVYARESVRSWPASAVLVAFDCAKRKVERVGHIKYQLRPDSLGVTGPYVEDSGGWVDVSVPPTFELVCRVGAARPYVPPLEPHHFDSLPAPRRGSDG